MRKGLVEQRKKLGLTQNEVANKIGVTRACYANYESGIRDIKLSRLLKIKKILNIKTDSVFYNFDDTNSDDISITKTG